MNTAGVACKQTKVKEKRHRERSVFTDHIHSNPLVQHWSLLNSKHEYQSHTRKYYHIQVFTKGQTSPTCDSSRLWLLVAQTSSTALWGEKQASLPLIQEFGLFKVLPWHAEKVI